MVQLSAVSRSAPSVTAERIFPAHFQLKLSKAGARRRHHSCPGNRGTSKGDGIYLETFQHSLADNTAWADQKIEHAIAEPSPANDLAQCPRGRRHVLGRFKDNAVTLRQSRGNLPCPNGNREVPRCDNAYDFHCLTGYSSSKIDSMMSIPSSTIASHTVNGGMIRRTLPYEPHVSRSRPRSNASAFNALASSGAG